jgi:hypothetical protein
VSPPTYPELWNRAWLYQRWVVDGRTQHEIAEEVGCTGRSVRSAIARSGLPKPKPRRPPARPQPVLESKPELAALYSQLGTTTRVAQYLHCSQAAVRDALDRLGIPRTAHLKYNDKTWFSTALRKGLTVTAMAAELGCDRRSVYQVTAVAGTVLGPPSAADEQPCQSWVWWRWG